VSAVIVNGEPVVLVVVLVTVVVLVVLVSGAVVWVVIGMLPLPTQVRSQTPFRALLKWMVSGSELHPEKVEPGICVSETHFPWLFCTHPDVLPSKVTER